MLYFPFTHSNMRFEDETIHLYGIGFIVGSHEF